MLVYTGVYRLLSLLLQIMTSDDDVIELGAGIINTLQFPSASVENGGRYVCSAELDGDTITAEAYLTILAGVHACAI